jgi:hypothetical protein
MLCFCYTGNYQYKSEKKDYITRVSMPIDHLLDVYQLGMEFNIEGLSGYSAERLSSIFTCARKLKDSSDAIKEVIHLSVNKIYAVPGLDRTNPLTKVARDEFERHSDIALSSTKDKLKAEDVKVDLKTVMNKMGCRLPFPKHERRATPTSDLVDVFDLRRHLPI